MKKLRLQTLVAISLSLFQQEAFSAKPPNYFLGTCLDDAWVKQVEKDLSISTSELDARGRHVHPHLHAALKTTRFTVTDPRTAKGMSELYKTPCKPAKSKFYGVGSKLNDDDTIADPGRVNGTLVVELKGWVSYVLTTMVFSIIAQEVFGHEVSFYYTSESGSMVQRMSSVGAGVCTPVHANMETWATAAVTESYSKYSNESYSSGSIGYSGRSGAFTTKDFVKKGLDETVFTPTYSADFWRDYAKSENLINSIPVSDVLNNPMYYPPKETTCANNTQGCLNSCSKTAACTAREALSKTCMVVVLMYDYYDPGYMQAVLPRVHDGRHEACGAVDAHDVQDPRGLPAHQHRDPGGVGDCRPVVGHDDHRDHSCAGRRRRRAAAVHVNELHLYGIAHLLESRAAVCGAVPVVPDPQGVVGLPGVRVDLRVGHRRAVHESDSAAHGVPGGSTGRDVLPLLRILRLHARASDSTTSGGSTGTGGSDNTNSGESSTRPDNGSAGSSGKKEMKSVVPSAPRLSAAFKKKVKKITDSDWREKGDALIGASRVHWKLLYSDGRDERVRETATATAAVCVATGASRSRTRWRAARQVRTAPSLSLSASLDGVAANAALAGAFPHMKLPSTLAYRVFEDTSNGFTPTKTALIMHGILANELFVAFALAAKDLQQRIQIGDSLRWTIAAMATRHRSQHHTRSKRAQTMSSEELQVEPDAVFGHSFGGKVALQYLATCHEQFRKPPSQVWVLDSLPGTAETDYKTRNLTASIENVLPRLKEIPLPIHSKPQLIKDLTAKGIGLGEAQWLTTNLRLMSSQPEQYDWKMDVPVIEHLFQAFLSTDLWFVVNSNDSNAADDETEIHFVYAERNSMWTPQVLRGLDALRPRNVHCHLLENSGHWVHIDNPNGLFAIIEKHF
ncbi:hypothetical protein FI667_g1924, partial [Globisporangium splendens]